MFGLKHIHQSFHECFSHRLINVLLFIHVTFKSLQSLNKIDFLQKKYLNLCIHIIQNHLAHVCM